MSRWKSPTGRRASFSRSPDRCRRWCAKGYGTNQLLRDGAHPRRYYDIRIWRNADAAARPKATATSTSCGATLAKHLHSTPLVDVAWAVEVGLAAAGPWQERRAVNDRRAAGATARSAAFSGSTARGLIAASVLAGSEPIGSRSRQRRNRPQPNIVDAARMARERAMAAFSDFKVGAALETTDGRIITGCNIENSTYGLTMCAERVAMFKALSEGHRSFTRIAVVADTSQPTTPCGACRQMLWEFAGNIEVILADLHGDQDRRIG